MAYEKTTSGVIQAEDTWAAKPAWMNEVQDTPGRITYPLDGTVVITTTAAAQYAFLVYSTALADANEWVIRVKMKGSAGGDYGIFNSAMCDQAAVPSVALSWATPPWRSVMRFFAGVGPPLLSCASWATTAGNVWIGGAYANGTYYVFETVHGAINDTLRYMLATDLTAYLKTGAYAHAYTNDPFFLFGDPDATYFYGTITVDYIQIMDSLDVVITNIEDGYVVKLYDAGDNLKATSAAAAGGEAVMDCSLVEFPFTGYFKVFDGAVEDRRLPAAGNFTEEALYGGDEWPGVDAPVGPTITSITPDEEQVGDPVTIAGTGYGAVQGASTVTFNGVEVISVSAWSDTSITCLVPAGATTGDVIVTVDALPSAGFAFTVFQVKTETSKANIYAPMFHFRFQVASDSDFNSLLLDKYTFDDQTNFEYWNGSEWIAFPSEGVSSGYSGNEIRYKGLDLLMKSDKVYWRVKAVRNK